MNPHESELRNISNIHLVIEVLTTGGHATSATWTKNGDRIYPPSRYLIVTGGSLFIGGGEVICVSNYCDVLIYRAALLVTGRLPGVYQFTGTNGNTRTPLSRSITIQGENV